MGGTRMAWVVVAVAALSGPAAADPPAPADEQQAYTTAAPASQPGDAEVSPLVQRVARQLTADLGELRRRRVVRVLVSYSKTNFFIAAGQVRGFECELLRAYEQALNASVGPKAPAVNVVFIPVPFGELLPALVEGRGDIAAAGLTITPQRAAQVAFTRPYLTGVDEIVVTHADVPAPKRIEDLSGRKVYVSGSSSYAQHLSDLNRRLAAQGQAPVEIVSPSDNLETEDLLEMVNAGILEMTVADRYVAELWADVLPNLRLHAEVKLAADGQIAWAVRKDCPQLLASLNDFLADHRKGTTLGNVLFKRYYESTKWITNPVSAAEKARLASYRPHFVKYAGQYGFDWVLMAAQGYQESRLDQAVRSPAGAVGVMQVKPATGREMGLKSVDDPESNIQAGIRYMAWIRDNYFKEAGMPEAARTDFALAAYNAGPTRVQKWRQKAAARGLDPNRWFYHVERIALEEVGQETVRYVANINKYYIAYRMALAVQAEKAAEKVGAAPAKQ